MRRFLADTGPIVALLNRRDAYHDWAVQVFHDIEPPLFTCEPVLTEAAWLVRNLPHGPEAVLELVVRGVVQVDFHVGTELLALQRLIARYTSARMSLADACLVRMTEIAPQSELVTLDRDFRIYRRSGRFAIRLIGPAGL